MTGEVNAVATKRKPAVELAPGDRLVRRHADASRAYTVESVGPFVGDKNRPMVSVKSGTMIFHLRADEQVEVVEPDDPLA